jgi:hypothetical protein
VCPPPADSPTNRSSSADGESRQRPWAGRCGAEAQIADPRLTSTTSSWWRPHWAWCRCLATPTVIFYVLRKDCDFVNIKLPTKFFVLFGFHLTMK